jgi:CDP-diacylglycerol--serine O-phosphatidyltransferase
MSDPLIRHHEHDEADPDAHAVHRIGPAEQRRLTRRRRAALKTVAVLPTLFTLGNGLCGFIAVFLASRPADAMLAFGWTPITWAAVFVFLGMVLDALDGRIARLTHQTSEIGAQLDSMSDMVTFGVAPAFIAVQLIGVHTPFLSENRATAFDLVTLFERLTLVVACIYVACVAMRLARYNIETPSTDEKDHMSFKGLPSPGAAGTVVSLVLLHEHFLAWYNAMQSATPDMIDAPVRMRLTAMVMVPIMLLVAWAMVSRLRYTHATNRIIRGRAPFANIIKLVALGLLLAIWPQVSLAALFVAYALSAPGYMLWRLAWGRGGGGGDDDQEDEDVEDAEAVGEG